MYTGSNEVLLLFGFFCSPWSLSDDIISLAPLFVWLVVRESNLFAFATEGGLLVEDIKSGAAVEEGTTGRGIVLFEVAERPEDAGCFCLILPLIIVI